MVNFFFTLLPGQEQAEGNVQDEEDGHLLLDQARGTQSQEVQEGQIRVESDVSVQTNQEEAQGQDLQGHDGIEMKTMSEK